jgi:putative nucleotidyltransferase with HDIG domain
MVDVPELLELAAAEECAGRWDAALQLYGRLFRASHATPEPHRHLTQTVLLCGNCYRHLAEAELAVEHFELALLLAELADDDDAASRALNGIATVQQRLGDTDAAEATYALARTRAERSGNPARLATIDQNLGTLATQCGDLPLAIERFHASLSAFEAIGHLQGATWVLNNLGDVHLNRSELDAAESCFDRALALCHETHDLVTTSTLHVNRAELYLARGETERALAACDEAFSLCCQASDELGSAQALRMYGVIVRAMGETEHAERCLRHSIAIAERRDTPLLQAEALRDLALVLRAQQRNREALGALNRAHALFCRIRAEHERANVDERIAQIEQEFMALVERWGTSIEAKDRYTDGHCRRVAAYACRIAEAEGLERWEMVWFRMGAYLHDIGKIAVPDEILNKPGRLDDRELALMRRHVLTGDEMLSTVDFPWDVRCMVRSHHERWDGAGYPDALARDAIPFAARILCIADVFDALTTTRSYHQALSRGGALRVMKNDAAAFDPDLFETFRRVLPELPDLAAGSG